MKEIFGAKKTVPLVIIIFLLSFITLFLIVEFRFLKKNLEEYEVGIQRIALNKTLGFMDEIKLFTENWAQKIELRENTRNNEILNDIAGSDKRIVNVYLLNSRGYAVQSLSGTKNYLFPDKTLYKKLKQKGNVFISASQEDKIERTLLATTPLFNTQNKLTGFLVIEFNINAFKEEIFREFMQPNYKVAIFDNKGRPVIWPFSEEELEKFNFKYKEFKSSDLKYRISKNTLEDTSLELYFFSKDDNFDTYRILTIMFLLFALYFCIYQFLVELWQANSTKSYFENIDFDILNHLKEGIIFSNKFNRVIFANKAAHDFFPEKEIVLKKSNLKEILGQVGESNKKFTLKKSDKSLEIIRSPIFKNGKMLGSLVVISENTEKEKLYALVFIKIIELLKDGVIFVDKNNEINAANIMAQYYLGKLEKGMNISNVNSELAAAIYNNIGSNSLNRVKLSLNNILCELLAVYDENGSYTGTLVFLKNTQDYEL